MMNWLKENRNATLILIAAFLGACAVACVLILSGAARGFAQALSKDTVAVKGYAEKLVDSDYCEWDVSVGVVAASRSGAVAAGETQEAAVAAWLAMSGVDAAWGSYAPLAVYAVYLRDENGNETSRVDRYAARLSLRVSSPDTALIERLSRDIVRLNGPEMALDSQAPRFLIRDLEQYKLELIKKATATATARAGEIVAAAGMKLGILKSANQGVFQVTAVNSVDVSGYGEYDTGTRQKKVSLVATLEFGIEG